MVSTSRNPRSKILSCLGKVVFFYPEFFASGNHYRNVEANFKRKTSLLQVKTVFLASEKQFLLVFKYSWLWKQFLRQVETYF